MKGKIILIVIVVALLGGIFYWFQWRPTQIRKTCIKTIEASKNEKGNDGYLTNEAFEQRLREIKSGESFDESSYNKCLLGYGLEK